MLLIFNIFLRIVIIVSHDKVMSQEFMHVIEGGYTITLGRVAITFYKFYMVLRKVVLFRWRFMWQFA